MKTLLMLTEGRWTAALEEVLNWTLLVEPPSMSIFGSVI